MLPISVCIIAKNEEARIERLLTSLQPYHFEIVIVDTGSTDRTKELAAQYTNKIFDFVWCNDFSKARNFSLQMASNDWILMMDCDEWIESIDAEELDYFRKHLSQAAGSVIRRNLVGNPNHPSVSIDYTERFFSRKRYHYTRTIHEQLTPKYGKVLETYLLNFTICHDGYLMSETQRIAKAQRNISLLQGELQQTPDDPYILYQLGKGYEMLPDLPAACLYYEQALQQELDPSLAYTQALVIAYGEDLLAQGLAEKALALTTLYPAYATTADFIYLMGTIYLHNKQYEQALDEFEKAITYDTAKKEGANSFLAYYEIGKILSMISEWDMARRYFTLCGSYPPALQALKVLDDNHL